jgi:hypothetical protein
MRDIRLYYYDNGTLKKNGSRKGEHLFESIEQLKNYLEDKRNNSLRLKKFYNIVQFVIVEYFDKYKSKIIEVI